MRRVLALLLVLLAACTQRVGDRCDESEDCEDLAEGYCAKVQVCTVPCGPGRSACPAGSTCVQREARQVCLATCASDDDCQCDESCSDTPEGRACLVRDFLKEPHGGPGTVAPGPR